MSFRTVTGQLAYTMYANSRIAYSRTVQITDWTTRGCHQRLCVLGFHFLATY